MHNLPAPITSFIGREVETSELKERLATARLLTLTGAPGIGKTRLAMCVAVEALDGYRDGVWLVELAPLADPALVPHLVAATLGVREQGGVHVTETLMHALRSKRMLLLLDNCEHLIGACAEFADDMLGACPDLQILATSRQFLGISGEVAWHVPSLAVPDVHIGIAADQVTAHAGTRLFVERASAARADFRVTHENVLAIVQVCRRLDGIPLALELAATRVRVLSVEQIAARLDDRFRLLSTGGRTAPPRQRTLRATLDWSYALLDDWQRRLFSRLSVFSGGWTLEAAEAICSVRQNEPEETDAGDVLDGLGQLVDQSLVVAEERSGQVRYRLLETMRQFAAEKLADAGESAAIGGRHRDWFLAQAERSPFDFFDPQHVAWLAEELDNLRASLRWSIQRAEVEEGLRLAKATGAFWYERGSYAEGRAWFAELLALPGASSTPARAFALSWAAWLAMMHGDSRAARTLGSDGLALARQLGDTWGIAGALMQEGAIAIRLGDLARAESLLEEGLSVSRAGGHGGQEFYHLLNLAHVALERGDHARAAAAGTESLAVARRLGHVRGAASSLHILGRVSAGRGDHAAGRTLLEESLVLYREHADWLGIVFTLRALADLFLEQGEVSRARVLFAESLALARDSGDRLELARGLEGLAGVSVQARPGRTVQMAGTATALREALAAAQYPWERERLNCWLAAAQSSLGQELYTASWTEGWVMPVEQAVALALADAGPAEAHPAGAGVAGDPFDPLSTREREVAGLIARGYTNRQIAELLVISLRTADRHVSNILNKLGVGTRTQVAAWAADRAGQVAQAQN